ncbi:Astacin-like metalloprotease toxin 1 [Halotydeus destructor]|nr:Astacin-like metalloprotease toxin 1 [Halotydeus destructor]
MLVVLTLSKPIKSNGDDECQARNAVPADHDLWPNATVVYEIDATLDCYKSRIRKAMNKIELVSCIKFRAKSREHEDYVSIYSGSGCHSHVGRKGGLQKLSLAKGCLKTGTILHELMHAIGFYHMHCRTDREQYLTVHYENIRKGSESNFRILKSDQNRVFTKFDFESIMMYGPRTFSKNKKSPTLEARNPKITFKPSKLKKSLSKYDTISLNKLYNCGDNGH